MAMRSRRLEQVFDKRVEELTAADIHSAAGRHRILPRPNPASGDA